MRIVIATDAWKPQVNGVVRSLSETVNRMKRRGYSVEMITPDLFSTIPCPGYSEIRLALLPRMKARRLLHQFRPDIVHIATEGPIGWATRGWCLAHGVPFTTAFHTRFPDYASVRTGLSPDRFWPIMRRFHAKSRAVMCATPTLMNELAERGITQTRLWSRGVDLDLFRPDRAPHPALANLPRPILLCVGRVAVEKNLESFLSAPMVGSKVIVGDGPMLEELKQRYPDATFLGALHGPELASAYAASDLFVFPSKTDTFGLVIIEALASGLPVAAYPVPGPIDILGPLVHMTDGVPADPIGVLDDNLTQAVVRAEGIDRTHCTRIGRRYSWDACVDQFVDILIDSTAPRRLAA